MRLVTVVKAPLRIARSVFRGVRDAVRPPQNDAASTPSTPSTPSIDPVVAPEPSPVPAPTPQPAQARPPREVEVHVEQTPNPHARKFTCSVTVVDKGSLAFDSAAAASANPLATALFALGGVKTVFAVRDFVTITCTADANWSELEPAVIATLKQALA